jgi:hypothetical protein
MNLNFAVLDAEADGLLDVVTKIHCIVAEGFKNGEFFHVELTTYEEMTSFLTDPEMEYFVGHNLIRYDYPLFWKILGIRPKAKPVDSLGLSWYLYPERKEHGLGPWGTDLGIPKPPVEDWSNGEIEVYLNRCREDVKINIVLWNKMLDYLRKIYDTREAAFRMIGYIAFKLDCAWEQEEIRWRVDLPKVIEGLATLKEEKLKKREQLAKVMPPNKKYEIKEPPKVMYKKDGSLSANGLKWIALIQEYGFPPHHLGPVKVLKSVEEGNPNSHAQLKEWLFSLGWKPQTFNYVRDDYESPVRAIPQISLRDGSDICPSVKDLYEVEPNLKHIEGYFIISHRIGILEGFLSNQKDGWLTARIHGFTNTMRFQHTELVNLPSISKPYGKLIRGCLLAPDDDHELCGCDMASLEDSTKHHYMYFYDPEFVKQMRTPTFDAHLDIGLQGGMVTEEEANFYKWMDEKPIPQEEIAPRYLAMTPEERKEEMKRISKPRKDAKQVNFSAVYGVGAPKVSLTTGWPLEKSRNLLQLYWKRNWSVKKIAGACKVKTIDKQMWLFNPVSRFWYTLRYDKDRFSTLNQSTGVYCFDSWVRRVRMKGHKCCGQFHDEVISPGPKSIRETKRKDFQEAIRETNEELKLNITLGISVQFGPNYAEIH